MDYLIEPLASLSLLTQGNHSVQLFQHSTNTTIGPIQLHASEPFLNLISESDSACRSQASYCTPLGITDQTAFIANKQMP